jgi:prepilin-type processing-associated H-X9-DG protein/prepilin-type N-terminal cleavage/methylation domain-containing protein
MIPGLRKRGRYPFIAREFVGGFTLVELLVVIGIIAILVGVLLPALNKARASAQEVQSASNLRQFGFGFQIYADANKGFLPQDGPDGSAKSGTTKLIGRATPNSPSIDPSSGSYVPTGIADPCLWYNAIPPLVNNRSYSSMIEDYQNGHQGELPTYGANSIWVCPAAQEVDSLAGTGATVPGEVSSSTTPEVWTGNSLTPGTGVGNYFALWGTNPQPPTNRYQPQLYPFYMCYVMNSKLFTTLASGQIINHVKLAQLRPGSDVVLMTEKVISYGEYSQSFAPTVFKYFTNYGISPGSMNIGTQGYVNDMGQPKACNTRFTTRHRQGGNLLFADGHVAWFAWSQVQGLVDPLTNKVLNINRPDNHVIWDPYGAVQNGSSD